MTESFSNDEATLYDRQIRLWGINAQQRLKNAKILVLGMNAVNSEITKCLVLAGINSLTVVDDKQSTIEDSFGNLFVGNQVGENRALACESQVKLLNTNVKITCQNLSVKSLLDDEPFFDSYHIVVLSDECISTAEDVNEICRKKNIPFIFVDTCLQIGLAFFDIANKFDNVQFPSMRNAFQNNESISSQKLGKRMVKKLEGLLNFYKLFDQTRLPNMPDDSVEKIKQQIREEFGISLTTFLQPTFSASIIGGLTAQNIIRVISGEAFQQNLLVMDCYDNSIGVQFVNFGA